MEQIKKTKAVAEQDPGTDVNTRRVRLGKISQAKEQLKSLYMDYRKEIMANALFMIASGPEGEKFAKSATKYFDCFSFQADDFYSSILEKVPSRIYMNKNASREFFEHLAARFEDRAVEVDITSYQPLYFEAKYKRLIASEEAALDMTKRAINEKVGSEVVGLDAIEKVSIQSVNQDYAGKVVPIVLYTEDETLTQELIGGLARITKNLFLITAGKTENESLTNKSINSITKVTKKSVEETLVRIKKNMQGV